MPTNMDRGPPFLVKLIEKIHMVARVERRSNIMKPRCAAWKVGLENHELGLEDS